MARRSPSASDEGGASASLLIVDDTFATPVVQRPLEAGGCRRRLPLGDEVPGRALRHGARCRGHTRRGGRRAARVPPERRWARSPVLRIAASSCVGCGRSPRGGAPAATPRRWPRFLASRAAVEQVSYPGLATGGHAHPRCHGSRHGQMRLGRRHGLVRARRRRAAASPRERAVAIANTRLFTLAKSLGGVESLMGLPAAMAHGSWRARRSRSRGACPALGRHRGRGRPR